MIHRIDLLQFTPELDTFLLSTMRRFPFDTSEKADIIKASKIGRLLISERLTLAIANDYVSFFESSFLCVYKIHNLIVQKQRRKSIASRHHRLSSRLLAIYSLHSLILLIFN